MTKVQISLTSQEVTILNSYGSQFGYNLTKTIRFLISKTTEELLKTGVTPTYELNTKLEEKGLNALKEHQEGETSLVDDAQKFFKQI